MHAKRVLVNNALDMLWRTTAKMCCCPLAVREHPDAHFLCVQKNYLEDIHEPHAEVYNTFAADRQSAAVQIQEFFSMVFIHPLEVLCCSL
jgi:hypothetical protein